MILKFFKKLKRVLHGLRILVSVKKLKEASIQKIGYTSSKIIFNIGSCYHNGSWITVGREYFHDVTYSGSAEFFIAISKNIDDLNFVKVDTSIIKQSIKNFKRIEDGRPFVFKGKIHCICACICFNSKNEISSKQIIIIISNNKVESFRVFNTESCIEKNWSLYDIDELSFIYSLDPFQKVSLIDLQGNENFISFKDANFSLRNNSNYLNIDSCKVSIGHEIIDLGIYYAYLHFFIKIDNKNNVSISESFFFKSLYKEFVVTINNDNKNILINFSNHDQGNYIARYKINKLSTLNWKLIND